MAERIRIDYGLLFRVELRHTFFLSRGDAEFEHMSPEQQHSVLRNYNVREFVDIQPTAETLLLLRRHRLLFRNDAMGLSVYAPLDGDKPSFSFSRSERLRFHVSARNRHFDDFSNLKLDGTNSSTIHIFSTDAANTDAEGLHLSKPLRGFRSVRRYPTGAQIVNSTASPTRRLTAVRNIAGGSPRDPDDWVETTTLPPTMTQAHVDSLDTGGRATKDGVVYEALDDSPGIDETDATKWRRLFAPGVQAASVADVIELGGRFRLISLGDASPAFVAAEITDRNGKIVRREEFNGTSSHPLKVVSVDFGNQIGGIYRLALKDRSGGLLKHNGNVIATAEQTLYVDGDAIQNNAFAVIEVRTDSPGYELVDGNGDVLSPTFLLRIASPATFWTYTFPRPLTENEQNNLGASFELADGLDDQIVAQKARSLARGFVKLQRLNTGKLLPNPTEQTGIAVEGDTGRLISPIYLSQ